MRTHPLAGLGATLALLWSSAAPVHALTFSCATIARKGTLDPLGFAFTNRFDQPTINGLGDVVFPARTSGGQRRLYLYPGAGAAGVVASQNDVAPPGGRLFRKFATPSINDDGDLSFVAQLDTGDGIFLRESGGSIVAVALTGNVMPPPMAGQLTAFRAVSRVNAAGDLAFVAAVLGNPDALFFYGAASATLTTVAQTGDPTGDGREFCAFNDVAIGDSGTLALQATTQLDCTDPLETPEVSVHRYTGGVFTTIVRSGDATPIAGTTYDAFYDVHVDAADGIGFRAKALGAFSNVIAVFLYDPSGPTTTRLVQSTQSIPSAGGELKTIPRMEITDTDRTVFRGRILAGSARHGIFAFDGTTIDTVLLDITPVPVDLFSSGAGYKQIDEPIGVDRSGTRVAFTAKVRDTVAPRSKAGVFRCQGS